MGHRPDAICRLSPVGGGGAAGRVTFTQKDDYVLVEAVLDGLRPGLHGLHVHEVGDCAGPGALAAGGHFDPTLHPHGPGAEEASHLGDLGNVLADAQGHAKLSLRDHWIHISGVNGILGRALIVQADPDDLHTQPSGGGGERIACGIILAPL
jgi:Cu-Zn family superoxide dismutase